MTEATVLERDPTRTQRIRREFGQHLRGRFEEVRRKVVTGIRDNDALGLQVDAPSEHRFNFPNNEESADAFETWLQNALDEDVLQQYDGDKYIRQSAAKGLTHADNALRQVGIDPGDSDVMTMLNLPIHQKKLQQVYSRAYENLQGITDDMADDMRDTLARGLGEGLGPDEISRNLSDNVESFKRNRATVLARTEVVHSHSEFTLDRYQQIGGEMEVTIKAEFSTAEDLRVCAICEQLEGKTYSISEMRSASFKPDGFENRAVNEFPVQPPVHPQCRCVVLPVSPSMTGQEVINKVAA